MSDGFVIDTPEGIKNARILTIIHALTLEVSTGLKSSRGSVLALCQREGLTNKRTKKGALRDVVEHARASFGYEPTARVVAAYSK